MYTTHRRGPRVTRVPRKPVLHSPRWLVEAVRLVWSGECPKQKETERLLAADLATETETGLALTRLGELELQWADDFPGRIYPKETP